MPLREEALRRGGDDWARSVGGPRQPGLRGLEKLLEDQGQPREKQDLAPAAGSQESGPLENLS